MRDFLQRVSMEKSVTVSAERFSQALLSSRFSNMTPEHLLELYFREKLVGKKEERQLEEQKKDRFLQHWKEKYQGTPVEKVLVRTAGCDKGRSHKKFK